MTEALETILCTVINSALGARGVGNKLIEAGETKTLELTEDETTALNDFDDVEVMEGELDAGETKLSDLTTDQLTEKATELGVMPADGEGSGSGGNVVKADIIAAIEAAE